MPRGNEKYKLRFANQQKRMFVFSMHNKPKLYLLDKLSRMVERIIRKNDFLFNFFIKYEKKLRIF